MKLYENKKEISICDAIFEMMSNKQKGHNFEYMITFDNNDKLKVIGKTWTRNNPENWGVFTPVFWMQDEYAPCLSFCEWNLDVFLANLFTDDDMHRHYNGKKFHVWKEIK